jgi:hypothetical protein
MPPNLPDKKKMFDANKKLRSEYLKNPNINNDEKQTLCKG